LKDASEVERLHAMFGGHPALTRRGMQEIVARRVGIDFLEDEAASEDGLFGSHLRGMLAALEQDAALCDAMRCLLQGRPLPSEESYYRLHSAGIVAGSSSQSARPRCLLYRQYLERRLL